jgi:hypothetical protein
VDDQRASNRPLHLPWLVVGSVSTVAMSLRAYRCFNIVVVVLGTENGHLALQQSLVSLDYSISCGTALGIRVDSTLQDR